MYLTAFSDRGSKYEWSGKHNSGKLHLDILLYPGITIELESMFTEIVHLELQCNG